MGRPNRKAKVTMNQTALTGTPTLVLTLAQILEKGRPWSREKDQHILQWAESASCLTKGPRQLVKGQKQCGKGQLSQQRASFIDQETGSTHRRASRDTYVSLISVIAAIAT